MSSPVVCVYVRKKARNHVLVCAYDTFTYIIYLPQGGISQLFFYFNNQHINREFVQKYYYSS